MQSIPVCLNNRLVGHLTQEDPSKEESLTFCYDSTYLNHSEAVPLSLSIPLSHDPYSSKIIVPYFKKLWDDLERCFHENTTSPVGTLSLGAPLSKATKPYTRLNIGNISFTSSLQEQAPHDKAIAHTTLIGGEFYDTPYDLLKTHVLKKENSKNTAHANSISNEIFVTLMAYNYGIPVPTISRFTLDDTAYLIMDRPDREASPSSSGLPTFQHCETLATAAVGFNFSGAVSRRHKKGVTTKLMPENIFNLIRTYGLRPALDFRTLIRTMTLCLTAGCDDYDLSTAFIALRPKGCRLIQLRHLMCHEKDDNAINSKQLLDDLFRIHDLEELSDQHITILARQLDVHSRYLKDQFKQGALVLSKIASEILDDYPSLRDETTLHIRKLVEKRAAFLQRL